MTQKANKGAENSTDFLGMSDEDFLQVTPPSTASAVTEESQQETAGSSALEEAQAPEATAQDENEAESQSSEGGEDQENADQSDDTASAAGSDSDGSSDDGAADAAGNQDDAADPSKVEKSDADESANIDKDGQESDSADSKEANLKDKKDDKEDKKGEDKPVDYKAFYEQVMAPFKANGRMIHLKSPEEAIRLMQMGAGYGRKIQDLQPYLKVMRMLEKHELIDEGKLSYLIDINNKNPDAIKKLIKESGIDPLDINTEDNVDYRPTNHAVSDQEMAFQEVLSEIQHHDTGQETLRTINQTWDPESKALLWNEPNLLKVIQSQRDAGIYDQVVAEIDRQKLLGYIPHSTPFLKAYKIAGDYLQANNGFRLPQGQVPHQNQSGAPHSGAQQQQVIATRTEAPKPKVQNSDKASAAAVTKTAPSRKSSTTINPLAMADDEFLKQFENRL